MYAFLLKGAVLPEAAYDFFTYQGDQPVVVDFRGRPIKITKFMRYGVRPSTNGKHVRLIFPSDPTRVITIDNETAKKLGADASKKQGAKA